MRYTFMRAFLVLIGLFLGSSIFAQIKPKKSDEKSRSSILKELEKEDGFGKRESGDDLSDKEIEELRKRLTEREKDKDKEKFPWDTIVGKVPETNRFGNALFTNRKMSFAPRLDIAAPREYIVGPGDELSIAVHGVQEVEADVRVSPGGMLNIPYVGMIKASGKTIESLENSIRLKLIENGFQSLKNGLSNLSITISQYRSIPITVVGAYQSGNYLVPSIATAFHALHLAGGPDTIGSYRRIKLVRNNKEIAQIDLYDFMINGNQSANIVLRENDVIVIPVADKEVEAQGAVKRPLVFELLDDEDMHDLLRYAGGFSANAHRKSIDVRRYGVGGVFTSSLSEDEFSDYRAELGDVVIVKEVRKASRNAVYTSGAVERSGTYGYVDGLTLKKLLDWSGGVQESALMTHGVVYRYQNNHQSAYFNFVPSDVVEGNTNFKLQEGDSVVIGDTKKMFPRQYIEVRGQVIKPSRFYFAPGMTVRDAILLAGGLTQKAVDTTVELYRQAETAEGSVTRTVIKVPINPFLDLNEGDVALKPKDIVVVREDKSKRPPYTVFVEGEVVNTGPYVLPSYEERVSSVLRRAGGLTPLGNPDAVFIVRNEYGGYVKEKDFNEYNDIAILKFNEYMRQINGEKQKKEKQNNPPIPVSSGKNKDEDGEDDDVSLFSGRIDSISIISVLDVSQLLEGDKTNTENDIVLRDGDRIIVQNNNNTVRVKGAVNNEVTLSHNSTDLLRYLDNAGGLKGNADKRRIFVIEPNGRSRQSRRFFWMPQYPRVKPGSIVVVPPKIEKRESKSDPARLAAAASIASSTLGVLFLVFTLSQ